MTDKENLQKAFKKLELLGYDAKMQTYDFDSDSQKKFVRLMDYPFEMFDVKGKAKQMSYLTWIGDGDEILEALQRCDVDAQWSGNGLQTIVIFAV